MTPWLLLLGQALAAPAACETLDEAGFRDLLLQLQAGIDRGDLALSEEVVDAMHARIPCLDHAPAPRQWAAYLAGEAIVRFAAGEPWEPVMATALRVYPAVDRGVSSRHPLASWEPAPAPPSGASLTGDGVLVDGLRADALPGRGEVHLVQRTDGRFWNSRWVGPDAPLPPGWASAPVEPPPRIATFVTVDVGVGPASLRQVPTFTTDWVQTIEPGSRVVPSVALAAQGAATFYQPLGVYARASTWLWGDSPGHDLQAAAIWAPGPWMLGAGVGATALDELQGPPTDSALARQLPEASETHRVFMPHYFLGTAHLRGGQTWRWHLGVTAGGSNAVVHGLVQAHLALPVDRAATATWRLGLSVESTRGTLSEQRRPDNQLDAGSTRAALTVGRAFGEY